jgi:hypothetical protein
MKSYFSVIASLFLLQGCTVDCASWFRKNETGITINGIVQYKYRDTTFSGRNQSIIVILNNNQVKEYPVSNFEIYNMIDSGDLIYKRSGTLLRFLIKGNDTIAYYPQCGGEDIK